jgi:hypothetical protein
MDTRSRAKRIIIWTLIAIPVLGIAGCTFWVPGRIAEAIVLQRLAVGQSRESAMAILRAVGATAQEQRTAGIVSADFLRQTYLFIERGDRVIVTIDRNDRVKSWRIEEFANAM